MEYRIDSRDKYILVTISGVADPDVYEQSLEEIFNHPDWRPGHSYIFDHSLLDASKMTKADIERIGEIARVRRSKHGVKRSAVVAPKDVEYGIVRMWMVYAEDETQIPTNVFRTIDEAVAWLFNE